MSYEWMMFNEWINEWFITYRWHADAEISNDLMIEWIIYVLWMNGVQWINYGQWINEWIMSSSNLLLTDDMQISNE